MSQNTLVHCKESGKTVKVSRERTSRKCVGKIQILMPERRPFQGLKLLFRDASDKQWVSSSQLNMVARPLGIEIHKAIK